MVVGAKGTPVGVNQALTRFRASLPPVTAAVAPGHPTTTTAASAPPKGAAAVTAPIPTAGGSGTAQTLRAQGVGAGAGPAETLPAPGVYVYDTSGYEEVSIPGSRRDYPSQTTITVQPAGCGVVETWQPFEQHTERTTLCLSPTGLLMASYFVEVAFYGQTSTTTVVCGADAYVVRDGAKAGQTWSFTCSSAQVKAANEVTFIGLETIDVAGRPILTRHVHIDTSTIGAKGARGNSPADYWFAAGGPELLVRNTGTVRSDGSVSYTETYDLELRSTEPQT